MSKHAVRRHATDGRVDGVKQLIYVASCSCGQSYRGRSRAARNRWYDEHKKL